MFETEMNELLAEGYTLAGRVGYLDGYELRARADDPVERLDHDQWMQLVGSRAATSIVLRIEEPGRPSPRVILLERDESQPPSMLVQVGGLYLGGRFRVVERIDDPAQAQARWDASPLGTCWVSTPGPTCC